MIFLEHASGSFERNGGQDQGGRQRVLDRRASIAEDGLDVGLVHCVSMSAKW